MPPVRADTADAPEEPPDGAGPGATSSGPGTPRSGPEDRPPGGPAGWWGAAVARWGALSGRQRYWILMAGVCVVGLVVRLGFVRMRQWGLEPRGDAFYYWGQGKLIATGEGWLNPYDFYQRRQELEGAQHPPGMPLFLALLYRIGVEDPSWQRVVMCFVGTSSLPVIGAVGRRIAGWRAGVLAAAIAAVYPNIWINDGMLQVETFFILFVALLLLFVYRLLQGGSHWNVLGVTVALTLAASVRPEVVVLFPLLVAPLVLFRRNAGPWRRRLLDLGVAAAVPLLAFTPWVLFNLSRFEEPVYLSAGLGQTLANANCPETYSGPLLGYVRTECVFDLVGGREVWEAEYAPIDVSVRDQELVRRSRAYISENRERLPVVVAARVGRLWNLYRGTQSIGLDTMIEGRSGGPPGTSSRVASEAYWFYWALLPLAVGGLVVLRRRRVPMWPLLVAPALATFTAMLNAGITRYRAGAEVTLVLAAAVALLAVARWVFGYPTEQVPETGRGPLAPTDPGGTGRGAGTT